MADGESAVPAAIRAAGAVLWRDGADGPEVALVHRPKYDDWSFPKGKLKSGEHVLRAAVREVEEETGVPPRLGRRLPTSVYVKDDRTKRVDYWAARAAATVDGTPVDGGRVDGGRMDGGRMDGTPADGTPVFVPNDEVDRIAWLPVPDAVGRLSHPNDADLLRGFAAGPLRTRPLVILRHGAAGEKREWREADELRPLDARGRAEAARLAALLAAFGPARLISSATARCLDTVLPYARRTGADVVTDAAFTVGETARARACERLLELVAGGGPVLVSTHGEIVTELVTGLCRELGEKIPEEPALRKGEFWVAHLARDTDAVAALERHGPSDATPDELF